MPVCCALNILRPCNKELYMSGVNVGPDEEIEGDVGEDRDEP
jgi:hypothetical protein